MDGAEVGSNPCTHGVRQFQQLNFATLPLAFDCQVNIHETDERTPLDQRSTRPKVCLTKKLLQIWAKVRITILVMVRISIEVYD